MKRQIDLPYTHTPGRTPHPVNDPSGHSFGHEIPACKPFEIDAWNRHGFFLEGLAFFNSGYYWEAHESWESVWKSLGRKGPLADFIKALIKLAAAGVKLREGRPAGARTHLARAAELLRSSSRELHRTTICGQVVPELLSRIESLPNGDERAAVDGLPIVYWPDLLGEDLNCD
jgi:hypothetical protein